MSVTDRERYRAAAHAMQSGVALDHSRGSQDGTPKHLRVGVNAAMCEHAALAALLISKGVFTRDEYEAAVALEMEAEVARYRERLELPGNVELR